jgi:riboflavin synthase
VSLTINNLQDRDEDTRVHINLIPHTLTYTTFQYLRAGYKVNIEIDMMARQVGRYVELYLQGTRA